MPDQTFLHRKDQPASLMEWAMRKDDKDLAYFGKRAAEEEARTSEAAGPGAEGAHARMGLAYRKKVKELREHASYRIVPEPD